MLGGRGAGEERRRTSHSTSQPGHQSGFAPPTYGRAELHPEAAVDAQPAAVVEPRHAEDNLRSRAVRRRTVRQAGRQVNMTSAHMRAHTPPTQTETHRRANTAPRACRSGSHSWPNTGSSSGRRAKTGCRATATSVTAHRNSGWSARGEGGNRQEEGLSGRLAERHLGIIRSRGGGDVRRAEAAAGRGRCDAPGSRTLTAASTACSPGSVTPSSSSSTGGCLAWRAALPGVVPLTCEGIGGRRCKGRQRWRQRGASGCCSTSASRQPPPDPAHAPPGCVEALAGAGRSSAGHDVCRNSRAGGRGLPAAPQSWLEALTLRHDLEMCA